MDTMQTFRNWLASAQAASDQSAQALVRLTQVSAEELRAFENDLAWETWGTAEPTAKAPAPAA